MVATVTQRRCLGIFLKAVGLVYRHHDAGTSGNSYDDEMKFNHTIENITDTGARTEQALRASEIDCRRRFEAKTDYAMGNPHECISV